MQVLTIFFFKFVKKNKLRHKKTYKNGIPRFFSAINKVSDNDFMLCILKSDYRSLSVLQPSHKGNNRRQVTSGVCCEYSPSIFVLFCLFHGVFRVLVVDSAEGLAICT